MAEDKNSNGSRELPSGSEQGNINLLIRVLI